MEKKYHVLYQVVNNINGMIYIGIHSTNNLFDSYMGSGKNIIAAIKEFGKENFTKYIIGLYDSKYELIQAEMKIVNKEFMIREDTYNIRTGGVGGVCFYTEEMKQNMSNAQKKWHQENNYSDEVLKNRSEALKRRYLISPFSEESKLKCSISNSGKIRSEEAKQKNREAHLGKVYSEETQKKKSESMKEAWRLRKLTPEYENFIKITTEKRRITNAKKKLAQEVPVPEEIPDTKSSEEEFTGAPTEEPVE